MAKTDVLEKARAKAVDNGHWALAAALHSLQSTPNDIDARINVVGAMHEVGLLRNSLEPYWRRWRGTATDLDLWVARCLDRIRGNDRDYWAIAALLNIQIDALVTPLRQRGYNLLSVRFADTFEHGRLHIATIAGLATGNAVAPVLELGWDESQAVVDAARWRAVILVEREDVDGSIIGQGSGSFLYRATLPYGCWRLHHHDYVVKREWVVPAVGTAFADFPRLR